MADEIAEGSPVPMNGMDCGNGSEADIDCRMAARRVERKRHQAIVALPPPPDPPFDIEKRRGIGGVVDGGEAVARRAGRANQTMEPIEVPPHAIWRDDFEEFGPDRWTEGDPAWTAPELDLGDGRRLVLDGPDPFPKEEWAVVGVN